MAKIQFKISAKAARLIGRENITGVDGAIIELVKNAYDADAECVYLQYNIKYPYLAQSFDYETITSDLTHEEMSVFTQLYVIDGGSFCKLTKEAYVNAHSNDSNTVEELSEQYNKIELLVQRILFLRNEIVLIDNGCGMTKDVVENSWMRIGTSYKETNYVSEKGRIKTGAKGIGRFALDKLSIESTMYTKSKDAKTVKWWIDWEQFSNSKLLNEIDADLTESDDKFIEIVKSFVGDQFEKISEYNWTTGTIIVLHPLREAWNDRLFKKVNTCINNLNPISNEDIFDIFVKNNFNENYSIVATKYEMKKSDYDYKVSSKYDGNETVQITIERNEMITAPFSFKQEYGSVGTIVELNTANFWDRPALQRANYRCEDYSKPFVFELSIKDLIKEYDLEAAKKAGPFTFDFYFLKSMKSDFPIIKNVVKKDRKILLDKNAGIKLYRDSFKVRPYGEEGGLFDWLGLSELAQRQPATVTHPSGQWNVPPYQLIGNVGIGRDSNPLLYDMANREGLVQNDQYYVFVEILLSIIKQFEDDRQFYYREYSKWIDENKPNKVSDIVNDIVNNDTPTNGSENNDNEKTNDSTQEQYQYTEEQYREAVKEVYRDKKITEEVLQLLMAFSASGIITNTFSHELSRVSEKVGDKMLHVRSCIDDILNYQPYNGDEIFNPYPVIEDALENDRVMKSWLDITMKAIKEKQFDEETVDLAETINEINQIWNPLMKKKLVSLSTFEKDDYDKHYISIAKIDLFTIVNNLNLNSAYFLEKKTVDERRIDYSLSSDNGITTLRMVNNGPALDEKYKHAPNKIFLARETSKGEEGTGLGLWIVDRIINKYNATINVLDMDDGFGLEIYFNQEAIYE